MRGLIPKFSNCRLVPFVAALIFSDLVTSPARISMVCDTVQESFGTNVPQPKTDDVRLLAPNERINEELSAGNVHSYGMTLTSGQYARVAIDQWGIDIGMALYGAGGQKLIEVKCRQDGPTPVSLIAAANGIYRLELRTMEKDPAFQGRYLIRIDELRQATNKDKSRIAAEKAFAEAEHLRGDWKVESSRKAIEKYREAVRYYRLAGVGTEEANALKRIGEIHHLLGDPRKAIEHLQQGFLSSQRVKDRWSEGEILNDIGSVYVQLGKNQNALEHCNKALTLSQLVGNRRGEGQALNNLGDVYASFGDTQKSLEFHGLALAIWRALNDRRGQAHTLLHLGYSYSDMTDEPQALDCYKKALVLWRSVDDSRGQALTLRALGTLQSKVGEKQEALNLFSQARQLIQPMGDQTLEATMLNGMGQIYFDLQDPQKALEYYNRALGLCQALSFHVGEGSTLLQIGRCHYLLGDTRKALDCYQRAYAVFQDLGDQRFSAVPLGEIGKIHDILGDKEKALQYYNRALAIKQSAGERREAAYTLNDIGNVYHELRRNQEALDCYMKALPLSRAAQDRYGEALALYNIARTQFHRGNLTEARRESESSLRIIESLRTKVDSQELRSTFFASVRQYYDLNIDLLMQMDKEQPGEQLAAAALQASERARARSLSESLTEARVDIRQGVDPALLARERSLQQSLSAKSDRQMRLLSGKPNKEEAEASAKEIRDLTTEYDRIRAEIKSKSPRYASLTQPQPRTLQEIQDQVLDDSSVLLEYALGDERSYLWAVTKTGMTTHVLPKRVEIEKAARRVYEMLVAPLPKDGETAQQYRARVNEADTQYWPQASALSQMVLGPVADQLGNKRLLIVAEGALQYLPFGALPKPRLEVERSKGNLINEGRRATATPPGSLTTAAPLKGGISQETEGDRFVPLIVEHEIVNLPSASALAVLRREIRDRLAPRKAVAVLADPVFEGDDPRVAVKPETATPRRGDAGTAGNTGTRRLGDTGKPPLRAATAPRRPVTVSPVSGGVSDLQRALRDVRILRQGGLSIPRLPSSREEAEAIMAVVPAGEGMKATGFQASRAMATSPELGQYRIVHFATHGLLDSERPELSGLVLSLLDEKGKGQNGFLGLHDIYNLNLPVDLVVLSACNTALGKEVRGEGLVGIVRGFMYAGAARVVASLWKVDDEATAQLMKRFYQRMLQDRMRPAAALRAAQVEMWKQKRWHSPYYWAAFTLQGEWK